MTTFLNWKNYTPRSKERYISNLFSYLSPRWYPVNVIGTNIYKYFSYIADQLSSASLESLQIYNDLFISTVRTTSTNNRSVSKIYDNFGALYEVDKLFYQDYEQYNTDYYLQSYRQQLRFLTEAYFTNQIFIKSIHQVGQAYTGISPIVEEASQDILGWKLTTITGSVLSAGDSLLILDKKIPRIGNIYQYSSSAVAGSSFIYTCSKLGTNTKILGSKRYNSGINCNVFTQLKTDTSFKTSFENSVNNVLKGDIIPRYNYLDSFAIWKPSTSSLSTTASTLFSYASGGYLYNTDFINSAEEIYYDKVPEIGSGNLEIPTYKGAFTSNTVALPSDYINYTWFYDWSILLRNSTSYNVYLREYDAFEIPSTIYFKKYIPYYNDRQLLSNLESSGSLKSIGHWVFDSLNQADDISGNLNNLVQIGDTINTEYIKTRTQTKIGYKLVEGNANLSSSSIGDILDIKKSNFLWESWLSGIDLSLLDNSFWAFKKEIPSTGSGDLITWGPSCYIDDGLFYTLNIIKYDSTHFLNVKNQYNHEISALSLDVNMNSINGLNITTYPVTTIATGNFGSNENSLILLNSTKCVIAYNSEDYVRAYIQVGNILNNNITFESPVYTYPNSFYTTLKLQKINDTSFINFSTLSADSSTGSISTYTVSTSSVIIHLDTFTFPVSAGVEWLTGTVMDNNTFVYIYADHNYSNAAIYLGTLDNSLNISIVSSTSININNLFQPVFLSMDSSNFILYAAETLPLNIHRGYLFKGQVSSSSIFIESSCSVYPDTSPFYCNLNYLTPTSFLINYVDSLSNYKNVLTVGNVSGSIITLSDTYKKLFNYETGTSSFVGVLTPSTFIIGGRSIDNDIFEAVGNINYGTPLPSSFGNILKYDGYAFILDKDTKTFSYQIKSGSVSGSITGSIASYLDELPYRPHYFACQKLDDTIKLYVDNNLIASDILNIDIPSLSSSSIEIQSNAVNIGMDEICLSTGSISPDLIKHRFMESAPVVDSRQLFNPDKYHQIQVQVNGQGKNEFEFHQFSLRGVPPIISTSSVPLPYFSIDGTGSTGYKEIYTENKSMLY